MCANFRRREAQLAPYVRYLVKNAKETGILIDKQKPENPKTVGSSENIAVVAESVCEAPSTSIHRRSQQLNIKTPYKVQLVQELKQIEHPKLFRFAKWA